MISEEVWKSYLSYFSQKKEIYIYEVDFLSSFILSLSLYMGRKRECYDEINSIKERIIKPLTEMKIVLLPFEKITVKDKRISFGKTTILETNGVQHWAKGISIYEANKEIYQTYLICKTFKQERDIRERIWKNNGLFKKTREGRKKNIDLIKKGILYGISIDDKKLYNKSDKYRSEIVKLFSLLQDKV